MGFRKAREQDVVACVEKERVWGDTGALRQFGERFGKRVEVAAADVDRDCDPFPPLRRRGSQRVVQDMGDDRHQKGNGQVVESNETAVFERAQRHRLAGTGDAAHDDDAR
jgi:hypothetical protein